MPNPFIVGERYLDRKGEYTITRLEGGKVAYRYDDGTEKVSDVEVKARIYLSILAEQKSVHPYQSSRYFWSIGFLARHGEFQAEVPPQSREGFEENYLMLAGTRPTLHNRGYYPIHIRTTCDKWGPELRIYFPDKGHKMDFPADVEVHPGNEPGVLRINNNRFWWQLVRAGFRLGLHHQIDRIREGVPIKYQSDFEGGFGS
jgi:hypothetical protein